MSSRTNHVKQTNKHGSRRINYFLAHTPYPLNKLKLYWIFKSVFLNKTNILVSCGYLLTPYILVINYFKMTSPSHFLSKNFNFIYFLKLISSTLGPLFNWDPVLKKISALLWELQIYNLELMLVICQYLLSGFTLQFAT